MNNIELKNFLTEISILFYKLNFSLKDDNKAILADISKLIKKTFNKSIFIKSKEDIYAFFDTVFHYKNVYTSPNNFIMGALSISIDDVQNDIYMLEGNVIIKEKWATKIKMLEIDDELVFDMLYRYFVYLKKRW